jgi:hypothetical protein
VSIPEAVGIDFAERFRIAVRGKLIGRGNGVVAEPLLASSDLRAARIEPQDRGRDRVEPLRLAGGIRVRSSAIAESMIAAAGVHQSVIGIAGLRRRVEVNRSHGVGQILNDVSFAQQLSSCSREKVGGRIRGVPFRDDVVVGHILQREAGRDEVGSPGVVRPALGMHGVEQAIAREFGMKREADESALEPVVDGVRKYFGHVHVHVRLVPVVDPVEKSARVVCETPAVWQIPHIADARPPGRRHVLIGGPNAPRVRKAHQVLHLDRDATLHNRRRNRVTRDLRVERAGGSGCQHQNGDKPRRYQPGAAGCSGPAPISCFDGHQFSSAMYSTSTTPRMRR